MVDEIEQGRIEGEIHLPDREVDDNAAITNTPALEEEHDNEVFVTERSAMKDKCR